MILLIDNFDSFTYNLVDYFHQLGEKVLVVRNNISPSQIEWSPISKVVLSPGPESPEKANFLMTILNECISRNLPCLGVCLGHQAINIHFGGNLKKGIRPMHGKVSHITHNSTKLFHEIPSPLRVVRYHSLEIDNLGIRYRKIKLKLFMKTRNKYNLSKLINFMKNIPIFGPINHAEFNNIILRAIPDFRFFLLIRFAK